jgi:hypothetical protein
MNKKTKQTLTKRFFFYMRQQSTKYQWRIEKPLKFMGRFGYGVSFLVLQSPNLVPTTRFWNKELNKGLIMILHVICYVLCPY